MQPDKIAMSMSAFEKAFENIEVAVGSMTGAMDVATGSMVPTEEVEEMMRQIAQVSSRCTPAMSRVCHCLRPVAVAQSAAPAPHERHAFRHRKTLLTWVWRFRVQE